MIKNSEHLKHRIQESITNLQNMGIIPADEAQLNVDVIYNSILDEVCSVVPIDSPNAIVSYLKLVYGSQDKALDVKAKVLEDYHDEGEDTDLYHVNSVVDAGGNTQ